MSSDAVEAAVAPQAGESTPVDPTLDRRTLFVRSVPFEASAEQLLEYFSQFVPVKHAVIVTGDDQKSKGFGFVSFTEDDDTLTALVESKKEKFQGRLLRVDIAKRRDRKVEKTGQNGEKKADRPKVAPVEKRRARLIIRNLPWTCKDPEVLKKLFSKYGAVFDAYIPKKKGGQMCGFAFVTMKKDVSAARAVKESVGLKIDGREVAVDLAVEKSKWEKIQDEKAEKDEEDQEDEENDDEEDNDDENDDDDESDDDDADPEEESDFHALNGVNSDAEVEEEEEEEEEEKPRKKSNRQEAFSVFVRNIPYDADAVTLKEHFEQFGAVKYALPVIDRETGLARGSAFVAFEKEDAYNDCLENAPSQASTSLLIADDVSRAYVYQGRILSVSAAVDRESASRLADRNSEARKEVLGKAPSDKDKRNLFLLNEGRITERSKLARVITKTDMELREKSYKLRVQQLNKNPTLHLSLTRLAIRNLPRAMNEKALKALGRKAVVQFATDVKEGTRQELSREEINRSVKHKHDSGEFEVADKDAKRKTKKTGVVKQAKVIMEVKGSGETGRSRGYGFIEFRDHKTALMGLRWLNAHEVSATEIVEGMDDGTKKLAELEGISKRKLIVEFAIENAQVMKRRREKIFQHRHKAREAPEDDKKDTKHRKRAREEDQEPDNKKKPRKGSAKKGNLNKGPKKDGEAKAAAPEAKSGVSDDVKKIIGMKRMRRKGKK